MDWLVEIAEGLALVWLWFRTRPRPVPAPTDPPLVDNCRILRYTYEDGHTEDWHVSVDCRKRRGQIPVTDGWVSRAFLEH